LAEREVEVDHEREYVGPRTAVEEILCEIWEAVLQVARVGIHDSFFELGGDSILSIKVKSQAEKKGVDFSLQTLFEQQTIARLAAVATEMSPIINPNDTKPFALLSDEDRRRLLGENNV